MTSKTVNYDAQLLQAQQKARPPTARSLWGGQGKSPSVESKQTTRFFSFQGVHHVI